MAQVLLKKNAAELQAAYNAAKNMPRYVGEAREGSRFWKKGQTYQNGFGFQYAMATEDNFGASVFPTAGVNISEEQAKSTRTTVIVAPGEYDFGASAFVADESGINIVSLTGNSDVIISSTEVKTPSVYIYGIKITADNILIKGINCKTNIFYIADNLDNLICEYCIGGRSSFGGERTASGTFNYCIGGNYSFGTGGTASGTFNYCTGGDYSFGSNGGTLTGTFNYCTGGDYSFGTYGGTLSGTFNNCVGSNSSFGTNGGTLTGELINCKRTIGTFITPTGEGKIYNCIDGNGNLVNYPALTATIPNNANLPGSPTTTTQLAFDKSDNLATTAFVRSKRVVTINAVGSPTMLNANADVILVNLPSTSEDLLSIPFGDFAYNDVRIINIGQADVGLTSEESLVTLDGVDIFTNPITLIPNKSIHIMCIAEHKWITLSSNL